LDKNDADAAADVCQRRRLRCPPRLESLAYGVLESLGYGDWQASATEYELVGTKWKHALWCSGAPERLGFGVPWSLNLPSRSLKL
jgi:hypothetical protein